MENWITYAIIAAAVAVVAFIIYKRINRPKSIEKRVNAIKRERYTPQGVRLLIENGASVTDEEITAIEDGLTECFNRPAITQRGYTRALQLNDYTVAILADSLRAPESRIWCYKVPVSQYGGSPWSFGKYILAAGQVVGSALNNIIALPDHHGTNTTLPNGQTDREELAGVAGHEAEHIILAHNDPAEYARTATHGPTTGHPLF